MEERARLRQRRREEQEGKRLCPRCGRSIRVSDLFATFQHYESCHPRFTDADLPPAFLARVRAGSRRTRARTPGPSTPAETRRRRSPTADPPDHHPRRRSESRPGPLVWPAKAPPKPPMKPEIKEEQPSGSEEDEKGRGNDEKKKRKKRRRHQRPPPDEKPRPLGGKGGDDHDKGPPPGPAGTTGGLLGGSVSSLLILIGQSLQEERAGRKRAWLVGPRVAWTDWQTLKANRRAA